LRRTSSVSAATPWSTSTRTPPISCGRRAGPARAATGITRPFTPEPSAQEPLVRSEHWIAVHSQHGGAAGHQEGRADHDGLQVPAPRPYRRPAVLSRSLARARADERFCTARSTRTSTISSACVAVPSAAARSRPTITSEPCARALSLGPALMLPAATGALMCRRTSARTSCPTFSAASTASARRPRARERRRRPKTVELALAGGACVTINSC
jgi:hypothetical protein